MLKGATDRAELGTLKKQEIKKMYDKKLMDARTEVINAANRLRQDFDSIRGAKPEQLLRNVESIQAQSKRWHNVTEQKGLCLAARNFERRLARLLPSDQLFANHAKNFAKKINDIRLAA